jgi:tripartite-type tricarboxylate transporter receptor subunit TctC
MKKGFIASLLIIWFVSFHYYGHAFGATSYPTKPVEVIVCGTPGGGSDISARVISAYFSKVLGIQLNVINKPGGQTILGTQYVMSAKPDGYTMLAEPHSVSMLPALMPEQLPYDWRKRTWCARTFIDTTVYLVRVDSQVKTMKELAEFIKKNPKQLRWGSTGLGGIGSPMVVQFLHANEIPVDMVNRVSFPGESTVLTALAGVHLDFSGAQLAPSWGLIEGKKIRPLAVVSNKRLSLLPEVPTVAEAGYSSLNVHGWHGITGPPQLPKEVKEFWEKELEKASKNPVFIELAENVKKEVAYLNSKEYQEFAEKEYQKYLQLAKDIGTK